MVSTFNIVCKKFYTLICESELWKFLLNRDFKQISNELDSKREYVTWFYISCFECKRAPEEQLGFRRDPLIKKALCFECIKLSKFRLINKTQILNTYGIDSNLINANWFLSECSSKVTYSFIFEFRKAQKLLVINFLDNYCKRYNLIEFFESLDVQDMDALVKDDFLDDVCSWKSEFSFCPGGEIFQELIEFIRIGKKLDFNSFVGNKHLG